MRKRRKRLRVGRLLGLLVLMTMTGTVLVGIGQRVVLWAGEWHAQLTGEWEKDSQKRGAEAKENYSVDTGDTFASEESRAVRENAVIAAFAKEHGLEVGEWPDKLVELLEKNPDAEEFVLNYPLKKNNVFDIDLSDYENKNSVPLFFQWDERWGYTIYGSNVMGLTGCGPTCLSMVCLYLLNDAVYTPRYMADFAEENGYYVEGSGSAWTLISEGGETLGLDVTEISLDENRMMKNLELGNPIICSMGPGDFTTAGHFIVLAGCKDGKFVVNDPNSITNSERLWSYDELKGQIKNLWACRRPE